MSQSWMVMVDGQPYGPYSLEQMRGFVAEGRVVARSLVAAPGEAVSCPAADDPVLAALFRPADKPQPVARSQTMRPSEPSARLKFGRNAEESDGRPAHFLILADMKSGSINGLEEAIFNLGQGIPIMPQAWLLITTQTINTVRATLVQKLGTLDMLFVADTTHDKAAWHNFGPEADTRIRRIWEKAAAQRKSA